MPTTTKPVLTASALLLTAALVGCGGGVSAGPAPETSSSPASTGPATPTATETIISTSGELTDAEILWLGQFNRTARTLMDAPGKGPSTIGTPAQMRAEAKSLRACSQALAGMKDPGPRLQSIYRTFTDACRHYDRAAECALAMAPYMTGVVAGSPEERKLSEASDCHSAEVSQGSRKLGDAYMQSVTLISGVPTP